MAYKKLPPVVGRMSAKPKPMPGKKVAAATPEASKTEHPGQTEMEREILDQIGCGGYNINNLLNKDRKYHLALEALVKAKKVQDIGSSDRRNFEFQMSIPVHMQWCQWGSENCETTAESE